MVKSKRSRKSSSRRKTSRRKSGSRKSSGPGAAALVKKMSTARLEKIIEGSMKREAAFTSKSPIARRLPGQELVAPPVVRRLPGEVAVVEAPAGIKFRLPGQPAVVQPPALRRLPGQALAAAAQAPAAAAAAVANTGAAAVGTGAAAAAAAAQAPAAAAAAATGATGAPTRPPIAVGQTTAEAEREATLRAAAAAQAAARRGAPAPAAAPGGGVGAAVAGAAGVIVGAIGQGIGAALGAAGAAIGAVTGTGAAAAAATGNTAALAAAAGTAAAAAATEATAATADAAANVVQQGPTAAEAPPPEPLGEAFAGVEGPDLTAFQAPAPAQGPYGTSEGFVTEDEVQAKKLELTNLYLAKLKRVKRHVEQTQHNVDENGIRNKALRDNKADLEFIQGLKTSNPTRLQALRDEVDNRYLGLIQQVQQANWFIPGRGGISKTQYDTQIGTLTKALNKNTADNGLSEDANKLLGGSDSDIE